MGIALGTVVNALNDALVPHNRTSGRPSRAFVARFRAARAAVCTLIILLTTCKVDKLTNSASLAATLAVTPRWLLDSAELGSFGVHADSIMLTNAGQGTLAWSVRPAQGKPWLSLSPNSGSAPARLGIWLDPTGLGTGTQLDTVVVYADDAAGSPIRVPVEFVVHPCPVRALTPDVQLTDSLTTRNCGAPHRAGSLARLYSFAAQAGDSVSVVMSSAALDGYVVLDNSATGTAPPLAQNDACGGGALPDACLRYQLLSATGTYVIEATSAAAGQTGSYTLSVTRPRAPERPDLLTQLRSDSTTAVPLGGSVDQSAVVLRGVVSDPDAGDTLRLEVEVRPPGTAFTGVRTARGGPVPSGQRAFVAVTGLGHDASYRWQARALDQTGRASPWVPFGENSESAADFHVVTQLAFADAVSDAVAGVAIAPAVAVVAQDAMGNTVTSFDGDVTVAIASNLAGGTLRGMLTRTAVSGVATFSDLSIDRAGAGYTLRAAAAGFTATSASFAITPAEARKLAFTVQPRDAIAGAAITPAVQVTARDDFDNAVTSFTGSVTLALAANPGGGTLSGTTTAPAADGVATFPDLRIDRAGDGYTLAASAGPLNGTSDGFSVTPAPVARLALNTEPSATAQSGVAFAQQPAVQLEDADGNPVHEQGVVVTADVATGPAGASLAPATATTSASGLATFSGLALSGPTGAYTLRFSASGLAPVGSGVIALSAGPASRLAIVTQPSAAPQSGVPFPQQPVIQIQDAAGNAVDTSGTAVTAAIASGGGALGGTGVVETNANGTAAFTSLAITGTAGPRTLGFTATGLSGATSVTLQLEAGPATQIAVRAGDSQSAAAGTAVAIPPAVIVKDASGNPVAGVSVTFAVASGDGSVDPTTPLVTGADGSAAVGSWTLGPIAGANTLTATAPGLAGSPVTFTASATVGAAASITKRSGDNLTAQAGMTLGTPHEVLVTDANGNPVSGVRVDWAAASGGGSVSPTSSSTDGNGHATTTRTLGVTPGTQTTTATATLSGTPTTVTFTITATVGGASKMTKAGGDLQKDTVGAALPTPLAVKVTDDFNNPVANVTITWSVIDGGGSVTPLTSLTTANGVASTQWTLGTRTGADSTQAVQATGVASPLNFLATARPGAVSASKTSVSATPGTIPASDGTSASTITVTALDGFGNPIPGKAVVLAATGSGYTLTPPAAATDANGVATGTLASTKAEAKTISATVGGTSITQTAVVTVAPAPASGLRFLAQPSSVAAGAAISPAVQVEILDGFGNRVTDATHGVTVAIGANPGGGALFGTPTQVASGGVATFADLSIDKAGTGYTLAATSGTLTGDVSVAFDVTHGAVSGAQSAVSAAPGSITAGSETSTITVTARDASGNPIAGATVVLAAMGTGNTLTQPASPTDASGVATGSLSSTVAESKAISATIDGVPITEIGRASCRERV